MMRLQSIYDAALATWGAEAQYDQAVEECAELIATLKHFRRGKVGREAVIDEVADVYLMLGQLIYMLGEDEVNQAIEAKIDKLKTLMDNQR